MIAVFCLRNCYYSCLESYTHNACESSNRILEEGVKITINLINSIFTIFSVDHKIESFCGFVTEVFFMELYFRLNHTSRNEADSTR